MYGSISVWRHKRQGVLVLFLLQAEQRCSCSTQLLHRHVCSFDPRRCPRSSPCQPFFKSQALAPKVFMEGRRPTKCAVLNDLAEKREPRGSLPCTFSPPSEHSAGVIIWQKTSWNRSDSRNYDKDEAWLLCRPPNFCIVTGRYASVCLGGLRENQDKDELESSRMVLICDPERDKDKVKCEKLGFLKLDLGFEIKAKGGFVN